LFLITTSPPCNFAALQPDLPNLTVDDESKNLLIATVESGTCRVVCFSPRHDLTLAQMATDPAQIPGH
jgi:UDPglucose--hexose-1-phosphate uridylyltransferase